VVLLIYATVTATRSILWPRICRKCVYGLGFAPDPTVEVHDAPPDPLVGWGDSPQTLDPCRVCPNT